MESAKVSRRCAIYTRKSSEEGLEQNFNSLQAARGVRSVHQEPGWRRMASGQDRVRRRRSVGWDNGTTSIAAPAGRHRPGPD